MVFGLSEKRRSELRKMEFLIWNFREVGLSYVFLAVRGLTELREPIELQTVFLGKSRF